MATAPTESTLAVLPANSGIAKPLAVLDRFADGSSLAPLHGVVDTTATRIDPATAERQDAAATLLQKIVTALAGTLQISSPLAAPVTGQVVIATTGTAVQLPSAPLVNGIVIKAKTSNAAQTLTPSYSGTVGPSGVTTVYDGTGNGYPLAPGEGASFACSNASLVFVNGTAGDVFAYEGN